MQRINIVSAAYASWNVMDVKEYTLVKLDIVLAPDFQNTKATLELTETNQNMQNIFLTINMNTVRRKKLWKS
jgi:hypothetical protein